MKGQWRPMIAELTLQSWICSVPKALTNEVIRRNRYEDGNAGKQRQPPAKRNLQARTRQNRAPTRSRWWDTKSQITQGGLDQDGGGHTESCRYKNRSQSVW